MTVKNTASFAQTPFCYSVTVSAANTNSLLMIAPPDGGLITQLGAVAVVGGTAGNLQFYSSLDGNTTTSLLPLSAAVAVTLVSNATAIPVVNVTHTDGTLLSPTNPIQLAGCSNYNGLVMTQSTLSNLSTYYDGGKTQGSANAQTLPFAQNSAGTLYVSQGVANAIVDFEANFTNTTTTATMQLGANGAALTMIRDDGTAIQANDIVKRMRYRGIVSGSNLIIPITQRIYVAVGTAVQVTFTAWGLAG